MNNDPNTFYWMAGFAVSAALVNAAGIFSIVKFREKAESAKTYLMCFAAGVLISTPLMLALPQAIEKNFHAGFMAAGGFLFMVFSNRYIRYRAKRKSLAFGIVAAEGIGIHSFVDGVIYAVTFSVSILTGLLSAIGLVVHEFAGVKKRTAVIFALLIASLTTPIGAFIAYPFIGRVSESGLGLLLGFIAGVLIYVSASHLLPTAIEDERQHSLFAFLGGVGLAVFIVLSKFL